MKEEEIVRAAIFILFVAFSITNICQIAHQNEVDRRLERIERLCIVERAR